MAHKLYYSISEVSRLIDEEQHILRYWEKEFSQLKPKKNRGGNRIYSEKDINVIRVIKGLLREEKLSLKGAKEKIGSVLVNETSRNMKLEIDSSELELNTPKVKEPEIISFTLSEVKELISLLRKLTSVLRK